MAALGAKTGKPGGTGPARSPASSKIAAKGLSLARGAASPAGPKLSCAVGTPVISSRWVAASAVAAPSARAIAAQAYPVVICRPPGGLAGCERGWSCPQAARAGDAVGAPRVGMAGIAWAEAARAGTDGPQAVVAAQARRAMVAAVIFIGGPPDDPRRDGNPARDARAVIGPAPRVGGRRRVPGGRAIGRGRPARPAARRTDGSRGERQAGCLRRGRARVTGGRRAAPRRGRRRRPAGTDRRSGRHW